MIAALNQVDAGRAVEDVAREVGVSKHTIYASLRRNKRKHYVGVGQPLRAWTAANQEWALDFVHDAVDCGRAIRVLSVVDAYTRECLEAVKESNNALSFGTVQAH
jgi:transposase InsO family protein